MSSNVLTHAEPDDGFKGAFPLLDLLLHERDGTAAQEIDKNHREAVAGRESEKTARLRRQLAKHVEDTLKLDPNEAHEEIRAAASLLLFPGRPYIWPIYDLDRHLTLAADRLGEVARVDVIAEAPEFVDQIRAEIEELRRRIKKPDPQAPPPKPPGKNWWQFWK